MPSAASGGAFSGKTLRRRQCHLTPTNSPSNAALNLWLVLSAQMCCTTATPIIHTLLLLLNAQTFMDLRSVSRQCCLPSFATHVASQLCIHFVDIGHGKPLQHLARGCSICILNRDTLPSIFCKLPHSPTSSCSPINACWESAPMKQPLQRPCWLLCLNS